uniref:Uncharacterized protein n=1 Tax=Noctiluca scintillans TaxID=2966 RepID=A0A7S1A4G0_NOCSC
MADAKKKNPLLTFISGGIAGTAEISVTMPLDTIKTQMQLGGGKGALATTRTIFATRGVPGFYFGMSAMLAQVSCKAAIRFFAFEQFKSGISAAAPQVGSLQVNFLAGLGAGFTEAAVLVTPTERLKILRQTEIHSANPKYTGFVGAFKTILAEQGFRGLFVGFFPTAARQGLAMGIRFVLYDEVKRLIAGGKTPTPLESLAAGMATGTISSLVNQPIDMAKSRCQAQDTTGRYRGSIHCLTTTLKEEGIYSWYRGCSPRVLRLTIGQGIIFSSQEHISLALKRFFN